MSFVIFSMSPRSSSLHLIYNDGSISLIMAWRIRFLTVPKYLLLLLSLSSLSFSFISSLMSSRHLFLSFIFNNLAERIFYDLMILRSSSTCFNLVSWSSLHFCLPIKTMFYFWASKLLWASTFISKAFSWAFCLSILCISKDPCPSLMSGDYPVAPSILLVLISLIK